MLKMRGKDTNSTPPTYEQRKYAYINFFLRDTAPRNLIEMLRRINNPKNACSSQSSIPFISFGENPEQNTVWLSFALTKMKYETHLEEYSHRNPRYWVYIVCRNPNFTSVETPHGKSVVFDHTTSLLFYNIGTKEHCESIYPLIPGYVINYENVCAKIHSIDALDIVLTNSICEFKKNVVLIEDESFSV